MSALTSFVGAHRTCFAIPLGYASCVVTRVGQALGFGLLLVSGVASGAELGNAKLLGLGGARRALGSSTEAAYVNPAGMSFARRYDFEAAYADDFRDGRRDARLVFADGQAGPVAGALLGSYRQLEEDGVAFEGFSVGIAAAVPLAERFAIGMKATYINLDPAEGEGISDVAFDGGFQWRLGDSVSLGASIQNFTAVEIPGTKRAYGAGLGFAAGPLEIEADIEHAWESEEPTYTAGAGVVLADLLPIRGAVAYRQEIQRIQLFGGVGLVYETLELELGYTQILNAPEGMGDGRVFGATLRIQTM